VCVCVCVCVGVCVCVCVCARVRACVWGWCENDFCVFAIIGLLSPGEMGREWNACDCSPCPISEGPAHPGVLIRVSACKSYVLHAKAANKGQKRGKTGERRCFSVSTCIKFQSFIELLRAPPTSTLAQLKS
jgi:hypothetical protein